MPERRRSAFRLVEGTMTSWERANLYFEARQRAAEGNLTGAFARYRRLVEAVEQEANRAEHARLCLEMGAMYQDGFELAEARRWLGQSLASAEFARLPDVVAEASLRLGQVEHLAGDHTRAEALLRTALSDAPDIAREVDCRAALAALLWAAGRPHEALGEWKRAEASLADLTAEKAGEVRHRLDSFWRAWESEAGGVRMRRWIREVSES